MKKYWWLGIAVSLMMLFGRSAAAEDMTVLPTDVTTASEGCILLGVEGSYCTDTEKAIARINEIRLEACREGVWDPRDRESKLTMDDYVPLKWSASLEYIARIRAAESSFTEAHRRTNGSSILTLRAPNGFSIEGENLAWASWDMDMTGAINMWYEEKNTWVKKSSGVTGHYTAMINPEFRSFAIGAFNSKAFGWNGTAAGNFSSREDTDETRGAAVSHCLQTLEFRVEDTLGTFSITGKKSAKAGETVDMKFCADLPPAEDFENLDPFTGEEGMKDVRLPVMGSVVWSTSDPAVAVVDERGAVTAVSCGTAKIDGTVNGKSAELAFTTEHNWGKGVVKKQPTTKKTGTQVVTCSGCGQTKTQTLPKIKLTAGRTYTVGSARYKITSTRSGARKVSFSGLAYASEQASFTIPNKVKIGGVSFTVTAIGANAFGGCENLEAVTIGKSVETIGKNAFAGCGKLAKMTIKSKKLRSVGKNSLRGIASNAVIKVPSSSLKKYKKLFKSSTGFKKPMKLKK